MMFEDYYFGDPLRIALLKIFLDLLMKFSVRIILLLLERSFTLVGCKFYKCVVVVTCLALTWVMGVTRFD